MKERIIRFFLVGMLVLVGSAACGKGPTAKPGASPTAIPSPISTPAQPAPASTQASAPAVMPTDTPSTDLESTLMKNGFARDKTLDSACRTPCSAYQNSSVNVIADYYYTNNSISLLYYARDKNGDNEKTEAGVVAQLLSALYPGSLSNDVMTIANDFPNHKGQMRGVAGNSIWSLSIQIKYNLDYTIKQAVIYIAVMPG